MDNHPIRILLVDDHNLFRSGIRLLLSRNPDFSVIGEASDGLEGIKRAKELQPDIVLMDLHMPGISGIEATQLLRKDAPQSHVILLTVSEDAADLSAGLKAGAAGYLLKNIDADYLLDSLKRVMNGDSVISADMTKKLFAQIRNDPAPAPITPEIDKLTPREREILAQLAAGLSNKEIARKLDVAESTVKIHLQSILKKLGLSNRVQAAIYAVGHGIL
ncbi:response regulator transcription factor [Orrella sp. NBD-18]|uniref:Response regulator transcription factor n=1 Tax=Sheuella amnicola TaxID=2707330 RepID=A0A6B2R2V1_9BURK|nr:response regulator transcription factor [Sheuella amnicola]NDY84398.1 response regulator transcription factor [Sheuella amnicola]HBI84471.1 DNA-binding response regulator [Alcaligenaceae bacterium]